MRGHVREEFDDRYITTLGTKVSLKRLSLRDVPGIPPVGLDLLLWDILSVRGLRRDRMDAFFHGTSGVLAVADMARRSTLVELDDWIQDVEDVAGPVPVVVIGANRDPADRREVTEEDVRRLAESYGAACFFASANTKDPLEDAFLLLAERIASRRFRRESGTVPGPADPT